METTNPTLTSVYQEIVASGLEYAIQHIGTQNQIEFVYSDLEPAASLKGHIIRPLEGAITGWATGRIWARVTKLPAYIAVTK